MPPLRVVHTSDWHLGHQLHGFDRVHEHDAFLGWLLDLLEERAADALLIAGDIFETANPPATAQAAWYRFLGDARRRMPLLDVVVIGGNHDSAARLDAPHPILRALDITVVGALPRSTDGDLDLDRLLVPLHGPDRSVQAWVAAVPYLRPADLPRVDDADDALVAGVRAVYARAIAAARERQQPGQALLAMGHCYMVGTTLSELSERRILGGNQHALPAEIFGDELAYVALGHLHKAQRVGGRDGVRYSGSPIPLSMNEERYRHQVVQLELEEGRLTGVESVEIPRTVPLLRLPTGGAAPLPDVVEALEALPLAGDAESHTLPFLEVSVRLDEHEPGLRRALEDALDGRAARLVRIHAEHTGDDTTLADFHLGVHLGDLDPEDVFLRRWRQSYEHEPDPSLLASLHELIDLVHQEPA